MTVRLGLIGRGPWGQTLERTLLSFANVSVRHIARGEKPAAGFDGVLIATPGATHAELALPYIEAGVATFVEKPMTIRAADAERLRDAARCSGAVVFAGHIFLHNPAFLAALDLLPGLGAIRYLLGEGMNRYRRADCSVLWDWLPHELSMARAVFGCDPGSVAAWSLLGGSNPQTAVARYLFGDRPAVSTVSWHSPAARKQTIFACEGATLVFDDKAGRRLALYDPQGRVSYPPYHEERPLTRELAAFLEAIRSGTPDASHIDMGILVARSIEAAERSIARGGETVPIGTD
jgi:predicted dehydrogenase